MFICKTDRRLENRFTETETFHRLPKELDDYLNTKMVAAYTDLHAYWTGRRIIAESSRLNQSQEFITDQIAIARIELKKLNRQQQIEGRFNRR